MEKWRERVKNLSKLSRQMIRAGAVVGAALVVLALMLLWGGRGQLHSKANACASAGISVFCFGVMAGLVVDMRT